MWKLSLSLLSGNAGDLLGTIAGAVSSGAAKLFAFYPVSLVDGFGTVIGGRYV